MTKCKFCNECKKLMIIMGPIWGVAMNVKNQWLLWTLYAGFAMNVKNQWPSWNPVCGFCNVCKKLATIMEPYMQVLQRM